MICAQGRSPRPFCSQTRGPPLSPWHASVIPPLADLPCAQIMLSSISLELYAYVLVHAALLMMFTSASWRVVGWLPPDLNVPHPVIQQFDPAAASAVGRATGATQLFSV